LLCLTILLLILPSFSRCPSGPLNCRHLIKRHAEKIRASRFASIGILYRLAKCLRPRPSEVYPTLTGFSDETLLLSPPVLTDSRKFIKMGIWRSFARVLLIILHVELHLPILPRAFFQDIR